MFCNKRRCLIVEEVDVTTVLTAISKHQKFFSNKEKTTENCGWKNAPSKWYVKFYASDREWGRIAGELSEIGKIQVKVTSTGTTDLYFTRS